MDVYQGHVDTFNHIERQRNAAFHLMMRDIYAQAKWVFNCLTAVVAATDICYSASSAIGTPGAPIAEINLDELEG